MDGICIVHSSSSVMMDKEPEHYIQHQERKEAHTVSEDHGASQT